MFKRKAYKQLLEWKEKYNGKYACLLEGARRVGKTTIAESFAKNEYRSYIKIDFSKISKNIKDVFNDVDNLDLFFLRLQSETGITLYKRESVIIFDEVQLFPLARQAIKHLVADGRYDYIETGSLISIKKNSEKILIPSEEHKIQIYPMDYEEFQWAIGDNAELLRQIVELSRPLGQETNRTLMRRFRLYMAIGGMPQAIDAYLRTNNFDEVDKVKQEIISLYREDIRKIDSSGRTSSIYNSIPSQLALKKSRFVISHATGKKKISQDEERLFNLIDAKIVLPCYNVLNPGVSLEMTKDFDNFKLYLSDIGLFVSMMFNDGSKENEDIYRKLLSDKLPADLGYLYENAIAQALASEDRNLYYHSWTNEENRHKYEIDFLIRSKGKLIPIEAKSSSINSHRSMDLFSMKYSQYIGRKILFSQKDFGKDGDLELWPIYSVLFLTEEL